MINLGFFLGHPVPFKDKCSVYPPKVNDIISDMKYSIYYKMLTLSQEEIEDEWNQRGLDMATVLTPLEYLMNNAYNNGAFLELAKSAFQFFLHEPVYFMFEQKEILVGEIKEGMSVTELRFITEDEYFELQNLIRDATGSPMIEPPDPNEHPKIKAMKAKARYRDKIKAQKKSGLSLINTLSSICCMNYGLNPLNIGELSFCALPVLVRVYQEKEKYQLDVDSLLAGADKKKVKPKYWIRPLEF